MSEPHHAPKQLPAAIRTWAKVFLPVLVIVIIVRLLAFQPVLVDTHLVAARSLTAEVMGTGTLDARVKATLSPKIQGRLSQVLVDQNDTVRAGQLLAQLDDGELRQQTEVSRAALEAARASVERVRADLARAEAVQRLSLLDHQRIADLLATRVTSQAEFDKSWEGLRVAEAELKRTHLAIAEAELQVITAEQTLLYQQERLADTQLFSPLDGLIIHRERDPGDVVVPGSIILKLVATNELWVSAWVDESSMTSLTPGQSARVVFRSQPTSTCLGEVARLSRQTDPETREFLVDVAVHELPTNWAIGQRAEVFIATGQREAALAVPARAVSWRDRQPGVFVETAGKARWRAVTPGISAIESVEIIDGLRAGEVVVIPRPGARPLTDGSRIRRP